MNGQKFIRNVPPPDGIHDDIETTPIRKRELTRGEEIAVMIGAFLGGLVVVLVVIGEVAR